MKTEKMFGRTYSDCYAGMIMVLTVVFTLARIYMYDLKEKTKEIASFVIGIDSDTFKNFDYDDEIRFLNRPERKKYSFSPNTDTRVIGRENARLARNEFLLMGEVNKALFGK